MNNTFSIRRFAQYAHKHYIENSHHYLYGILIVAAASIIILYFFPYDISENLILPLLFGSVYFTIIGCRSHYSLRSIEQSYTLPASSSEKYLFIWINSVILTTIITIAIIWIVSIVFTIIYKKPVGLSFSEFEYPLVLTGITAYLLFQAGILLSCCWGKGSPMRVFLIIIGLFIACTLMYIHYMQPAADTNFTINLFDATCNIRSENARIQYPLISGISMPISISLTLGFWTLVMWITAYFKFKERTLK